MRAFNYTMAILVGFGSGVVISGAVFAFIAIIGIVPRLAQKTKTVRHIMLYEESIIVGGVFGALTIFIDFKIYIGWIAAAALSFCNGIFYGCLAVSLAEVLDVIPILTRRGRVQKGMYFFMLSLAVGKLVGSLLYFYVPGFYEY